MKRGFDNVAGQRVTGMHTWGLKACTGHNEPGFLHRLESHTRCSSTIWEVALREFVNLELRIDNAKPSNLLDRNGSWVKESIEREV
jgi:hypothetical protein